MIPIEIQRLFIKRAKEAPGDTNVFLGSTIIRFGDVSRKEWEGYDVPGNITKLLSKSGVAEESIIETEHGGLPALNTGPLSADQLIKFATLVAQENESYGKDLGIKREDIVGKNDFDFQPMELDKKYRAYSLFLSIKVSLVAALRIFAHIETVMAEPIGRLFPTST